MKLGDLKPKGSGKTLAEWVEICIDEETSSNECCKCKYKKECDKAFTRYTPTKYKDCLDLEVEL